MGCDQSGQRNVLRHGLEDLGEGGVQLLARALVFEPLFEVGEKFRCGDRATLVAEQLVVAGNPLSDLNRRERRILRDVMRHLRPVEIEQHLAEVKADGSDLHGGCG